MHEHGHSRNKRGLVISLLLTASVMILEFAGGFFTNSLALLSDAGHMLSDTGSLLLSLLAVWYSGRPPSPSKTFGFYRFEILAALLNGAALFVIAGLIVREAYLRLWQPPTVQSGAMIAIAVIGLLSNVGSAWALTRHGDQDNVNIRSAYLHVLGDALGSVGAIVAGLLMYYYQWYLADPIISVFVGLLVLRSAWRVIDESLHILMEGTPPTIDWEEVRDTLLQIGGVVDVHDLHIWSITSGMDTLTCHIRIEKPDESQRILREAIEKVGAKYQVRHTTIQIETDEFNHEACASPLCPT